MIQGDGSKWTSLRPIVIKDRHKEHAKNRAIYRAILDDQGKLQGPEDQDPYPGPGTQELRLRCQDPVPRNYASDARTLYPVLGREDPVPCTRP